MHTLRRSLWVLILLASTLLASPTTAAQGNSQAAATCKQGGWQSVYGANGEVFVNQGECVSYAARGGVLMEAVPTVFFVDMGNPTSEASFGLQGWGVAEDAPLNPYTSPSGDRTKRFQALNQDNTLTFAPVMPGSEYVLTAEVEDGGCADNFEIFVNGERLYSFEAVVEPTVQIRSHTVVIPADIVTSGSLTVDFHNISGDECGRAAVFNVQVALA